LSAPTIPNLSRLDLIANVAPEKIQMEMEIALTLENPSLNFVMIGILKISAPVIVLVCKASTTI
jgi:hypothetical protein